MKIKDGVYWVGTLNPTLRVFDVIMTTGYGTTYNSYLLMDEKVALVDANRGRPADRYLEKIRALVDPAKIDYIIVQHTEPDHTGSLSMLLEHCPNAQVLSTRPAARWLPQIMNRDFNSRVVEDGEELSLGRKTLRFMVVPFWHWPDTMFTYLKEDKILFPCDGFGAHFCDERLYDDLVELDAYSQEFAGYYDAIMRPFADKIYDGVQRVKELDLEMICPSHGPILRSDPRKAVDLYERWSAEQRHPARKLAIFYASAYGNTRRMAEAMAEGARKHVEVSLTDAGATGAAEMRNELESASGVLIGSCTINGDALEPVWGLMSLFALVNRKGKQAAAFGSYGWSGEAVGMIEERLRGLKLKVLESGLKVNFVPTEDDLERCRAFGEEFAGQLVG